MSTRGLRSWSVPVLGIGFAALAACSTQSSDPGESTAGSTSSASGTGSVSSSASSTSSSGGSGGSSSSSSGSGGSGGAGGSGGSGGGGAMLDPNVSPGGNFDLSGWQLQLPIGSGSPDMIPGSQLAGPSGFTDIYFYTDKTDGAMTFMDPTTGVTTSGSLHPRSELREVTKGWSTAGTNTQTVTLAVPEVPDHVAIGQIFQAAPAPSKPLLELQYAKGGGIKLLLENTNQGGNATTHDIGTVADGSTFTYELSLTGTTIKVTIDGAASTFTLPSSFAGESFYFKCGAYDQTAVAGTPGTTPGTVVKVYALEVVHQ